MTQCVLSLAPPTPEGIWKEQELCVVVVVGGGKISPTMEIQPSLAILVSSTLP